MWLRSALNDITLVIAAKSVQWWTVCQHGRFCLQKTCMIMQQPLYPALHHLENFYIASYRCESIETCICPWTLHQNTKL